VISCLWAHFTEACWIINNLKSVKVCPQFRIVSSVKRVEFVSDRVSCIVLRGHWCNIILVNVHALSEEKSEDSRDSFYEELEQVFDHFA